mgnify:FL=1
MKLIIHYLLLALISIFLLSCGLLDNEKQEQDLKSCNAQLLNQKAINNKFRESAEILIAQKVQSQKSNYITKTKELEVAKKQIRELAIYLLIGIIIANILILNYFKRNFYQSKNHSVAKEKVNEDSMNNNIEENTENKSNSDSSEKIYEK